MVDDAVLEFAERGHEDVRPVHDFAMRAIAAGADNASELGRRLSVSKQAAAKTVAVLEERGWSHAVYPIDARRNAFRSRRSVSTSCEQARPSSTNCATSGSGRSAQNGSSALS